MPVSNPARSADGRPFSEILLPGPGRIAVKIIKGNNEYVGETGVKLIIPDIAFSGRQGEGNMAEVVCICRYPYLENGIEITEPDYPVGTIVCFNKYTGTQLTIGRDSIIIMGERDVLCEVLSVPPEDQSSDSATDADVIRAFDSTLSLHSPATPSRGANSLPPLPAGLGDPAEWSEG